MRAKPSERIEDGRVMFGQYKSPRGVIWGAYNVVGPSGRILRIIVDDGQAPPPDKATGWEHCSVSIGGKHPPNWEEMAWVKEQFWEDEETVLQFHPMKSEYKNLHPNCLHLWRNVGLNHPLPDRSLV